MLKMGIQAVDIQTVWDVLYVSVDVSLY